MERKPVYGVDHDRDAGKPGREPAENAGLGAVGVDNLIATLADHPQDSDKGARIEKWMDASLQNLDDFDPDPPRACLTEHVTFRSNGWTRDDLNIISQLL